MRCSILLLALTGTTFHCVPLHAAPPTLFDEPGDSDAWQRRSRPAPDPPAPPPPASSPRATPAPSPPPSSTARDASPSSRATPSSAAAAAPPSPLPPAAPVVDRDAELLRLEAEWQDQRDLSLFAAASAGLAVGTFVGGVALLAAGFCLSFSGGCGVDNGAYETSGMVLMAMGVGGFVAGTFLSIGAAFIATKEAAHVDALDPGGARRARLRVSVAPSLSTTGGGLSLVGQY